MGDYNPICIMSSSWMFDDIVMNLYRNEIEKEKTEVIDCNFTIIKDNKIILYIGSL